MPRISTYHSYASKKKRAKLVPIELPDPLPNLNKQLLLSDIKVLLTGAGGVASRNFAGSLRLLEENSPEFVGVDISRFQLQAADIDFREIVPKVAAPEYGEKVRQIYHMHDCNLLHPQPDVEVEYWARKENCDGINTLLPSSRILGICQDKYKTHMLLKKTGIPTPETCLVCNYKELLDIIDEILFVSGQDRVWIRATKGAGSKAALPIFSESQAKEWIHYWRTTRRLDTKDFIICEYLPGREYAFQSLWLNGRLIVSQARERVQYLFGNLFPSGQSSSPSVARTVSNPLVNKIATEAVSALAEDAYRQEITGIFCVDLKEREDGIPCVTEINAGRFFTTSDFFSAMKLNMPAYYVAHAVGKVDLERYDLPRYDILPPNYYWIRTVDYPPVLFHESEL